MQIFGEAVQVIPKYLVPVEKYPFFVCWNVERPKKTLTISVEETGEKRRESKALDV